MNSESNSILCFDRSLGFFKKLILLYKCLIIRENNHTKAFSLKLENSEINDNAIVCGYPDTRLYEYFYVKV